MAGFRIVSIPTPPERLDFGPRPEIQLDPRSESAGTDIMRSPHIRDVQLSENIQPHGIGADAS